MNILQRILEHSRNARVPRARDPETHEPIPYGKSQSAAVKVGARILSTPWANRMMLKWIAALSGFMTTWLIAKGAGEHTTAIVAGVVAILSFGYEQLASYLNSKATMKIPPRVGGQSLAPVTQSTSDSSPTFTGQFIVPHSLGIPSCSGSNRSRMFKAIIAKPTSPAEDETALLDLRASLHRPAIAMPTAAEQEATRAKLEGYPVEFEGKVLNFDSATLAYMFRNQCKLDGKTANVLF